MTTGRINQVACFLSNLSSLSAGTSEQVSTAAEAATGPSPYDIRQSFPSTKVNIRLTPWH